MVQFTIRIDLKPSASRNRPVPPYAFTLRTVTFASSGQSVTMREPSLELAMIESWITTGSVVLIVTAGVELVDVQVPEYVPPAVIVIGDSARAGTAGAAWAIVTTKARTPTVATSGEMPCSFPAVFD
jgi:hypothetical protein